MKHKFFLSLIWAAFNILFLLQNSLSASTVNGQVISKDGQDKLINANVVIENSSFGAATNLDGNYVILNVPPGIYSIRGSMIGFEDVVITDIIIHENTAITLNLELPGTNIVLSEVEIKSAAQKGSIEREMEERLIAGLITDALVSSAMRSMPDPNISQVVKRAAGVSTSGGSPIIRGLGARYSKVTLNQSQIAGTEPNSSGVSLDLFPSSMVNKVTINKSYQPDQAGEFGGGTINMDTWEIPVGFKYQISTSFGYKPNLTFKKMSTYEGSNLDFLGFDDGARSLPDAIENTDTKITERGRFSEIGLTSGELETLGESFSNTWNAQSVSAMPNQSYNLSISNSRQLWGRPFGYMVNALYKNGRSLEEVDRFIYKGGADGAITRQHDYHFQYWKRNVVLGGLAAMRYDINPLHNISLNAILNRDVEDETRYFSGYNDDRQSWISDTRLRWVAQTTMTGQLSGRHAFPVLNRSSLNWQMTGSRGIRYEPDTREVQYEGDSLDGIMRLADEAQSGSRIFNDLVDNSFSMNIDWVTPFQVRGIKSKLKTGYAMIARNRDAQTRFFQFEFPTDGMVDLTMDPETIFMSENIDSTGFQIREATRPTDSYKADHNLHAMYVMTDAQLTSKFRIIGGLRYEKSRQQVESYELFTSTLTPVIGSIETGDVLPAINLIYNLQDRTNLRFAASQTISRPDFRELSEFEFTDIIGGHAVIGNPELKRALVRNFDLRYELVHGGANLFAVSVFYKYFLNPIEVVIQSTAQNRVSYENAKSADNYGVELEFRQAVGDLIPKLNSWYVSTNLTLLNSDIQLSDSTKGIQTSSRRPLHGQSPYLFNLNLKYNDPYWNTDVDLYYHVFGKRISEVGSKPLPDIYEMPHPDLDLVINQPLTPGLRAKFSVENILDPEITFNQGSERTKISRTGRVFSIGISYQN